MAQQNYSLAIWQRVRKGLTYLQPIQSFLLRPHGKHQLCSKPVPEWKISIKLDRLHSFICSQFPIHWITPFFQKSSKNKMSLTKSFNPMEKILLKQAARIIDHLVESKPEDVNWELIDRFQDLLERYLTKEKKKLPTNERTAA